MGRTGHLPVPAMMCCLLQGTPCFLASLHCSADACSEPSCLPPDRRRLRPSTHLPPTHSRSHPPHLCAPMPAAEYSTRFAGQVKSLDCDGYVLKKWEKRIDVTMK